MGLGIAFPMINKKPALVVQTLPAQEHRYSFAEIAQAVGINENTVRSHFTSFSDVLPSEKDVGPRGKRAFSAKTFNIYKLFLVLKGDDIRLTSTQAIELLRKGHYDTLQNSFNRDISSLLITVQRLRADAANTVESQARNASHGS